MTNSHEDFGSKVWHSLQEFPLGSLTKRELELTLLRAAIDARLLDMQPSNLAQTCRIPLTRAHGYLTDLALRQPPLSDSVAISRLVGLLNESEVVEDASHLSLPLHDAALRIWLERKMALLNLNAGDSLRRDLVKLTPSGLAKLLGVCDGIVTPYEALQALPATLKDQAWVKAAKKQWRKGISWQDAVASLGTAASMVQAVPALLQVIGA